MAVPRERTVVLLAGLFEVEPHDLVDGTGYPAAKTERLPLVVTCYTEVELQPALCQNDLAWVDRAEDGALARRVADGWRPLRTRL